ncbi:MAG: peptidylprolyl isomerase, partial [Hyphomicrobium sp.]
MPSQSDTNSSQEQKTNPQSKKPDLKTGSKPSNRTITGALKEGTGDLLDQAIVALVNDEPITGYEIAQRQRLMSMGNPNISQKAQSNFKALIQSPSTNDQLKSILNKTIKDNPGKSKTEIIAIFDQ